MIVQQIRSATIKVTYGEYTFLVDPWLQDKGKGFSASVVNEKMKGIHSPMCDLPFSCEEILKNVDFCICTHVHGDHFTPDYLPKDLKIYVQNKEDIEKVKEYGFTDVVDIPDEGLQLSNISIYKTVARHGDNDYTAMKMGNVHGYIFEGETKSLYVAGDTIYYEGVEKVLKEKNPDIIVLNCCEATLPYGRLIMDMNDIDSVYNISRDGIIIASHLENVNHALIDRKDILKHKLENHMERLLIPDDGEVLTFE